MGECPFNVEESDFSALSPLLASTVGQLSEDADKFDHIMAFFIALMAQNAYRPTCLYDTDTNKWAKTLTCIPPDWKRPGTNIYYIAFRLSVPKDCGVICQLVGIPTGDWMVLNLLPKGASRACKTRSTTVNVAKYVNLHQKLLGKFWHLKELAYKFKNELFVPVHSHMLLEVGIASPCLQGIPEEARDMIFEYLDSWSLWSAKKALETGRPTR
ncbi:uncharacterized protein LOC106637781 [Copidosoma floridanum]|uniref:uncharacterized protein LOC106637781 n=1 Tax=Copidosoma floridanum TaxID=29053 RepID=UPI0006C945EC|nr:uncharacterized protein LOC106637781 [Copidosoma floridanum]